MDFQNAASLCIWASGRPLNSEFITVHPSSTEISMARFQYRTAACLSSSLGLDQRYSGSSDDKPTPVSFRLFLSSMTRAESARGWTKNGRKSERGDSSMKGYS